jgi:hypothetical protein
MVAVTLPSASRRLVVVTPLASVWETSWLSLSKAARLVWPRPSMVAVTLPSWSRR